MKITISRFAGKEALYGLALAIFIFRYVVLFYSEYSIGIPNIVHNMCYLFTIALLVIKALISIRSSIKSNKAILYYITLIIGCIIGVQLLELNFVATVLLISLAYDIDFNKTIKLVCFELIFLMIFVILSCKAGIIQDQIRYKYNYARHGLGFTYIGAVGAFYLHIVLMLMFIQKEKMKWRTCIFLYLIEIIVFIFDGFVGNFVLSSLLFLSFILFIKLNLDLFGGLKRIFWKKIALFLYPLVFVVSIIIPLLYYQKNFRWLDTLDKLLNGRISIPSRVIFNEGIHLFANNFETVGLIALDNGATVSQYNYIDNGFLNILLRYGVIMAVIVCVVYTIFFVYSIKQKDKMNIIWLLLLLGQSIVYAYLINIPNNILAIFVFSSLMRGNRSYRLENYRNRDLKTKHYKR